jgi:integrase
MRQVRIKEKRWTHKGKAGFKYQVLYPDPKTGKERSAGVFATKKLALTRQKEIEQKLYSLTEFGQRETRTVGDLLRAFMLDINERHRATITQNGWREKWSMGGKTQKHYEYAVEALLLPRLGDIVLIALTFEDCQRCVDEVKAAAAPSAGLRAGTALKTALRFGHKRGWLISPLLLTLLPELRLPPKGLEEKRRALPDQLSRVFGVLYGPRDQYLTHEGYLYRRALWLLFVTNGPRRSEVAALRWEGIDWQAGVGRIEDAWCGVDKLFKPTKTPAGDRSLWLAEPTVAALNDIWESRGRPSEGLVFTPLKPGQSIYSGMYKNYLIPVLREANLLDDDGNAPFHWHALRRTANSLMAAGGVSQKARQVAFGWSDPKMADDIYRSLMPQEIPEMRNATNAIAHDLVPLRAVDPEAAMSRMTPRERRNKYSREWARQKRRSGQGADKNP